MTIRDILKNRLKITKYFSHISIDFISKDWEIQISKNFDNSNIKEFGEYDLFISSKNELKYGYSKRFLERQLK